MAKRIISFAAAMLLAISASAVPARPYKHQVKQADGTMLTVMTRGDENFHFTCTEDGIPVFKAADGSYYYAKLGTGKHMEASRQLAHDVQQRSQQELSFVQTNKDEFSAIRSLGRARAIERNGSRMARLMKRGTVDASGASKIQQKSMAGPWGGDGIGVTGKRKGLVILVNFKDKKMQASHTQQEWNNYFNQEGYSKLGNSGSVHDYFKAQSYGKFDLEFDVVGPVTVSKNMEEYGGNDSYGNDKDPAGMVYEACKLVDSKVNFADYDWDGDGEVDQVYLIYAGYGEASASEIYPETIWQHEWELNSAGYSLTLDGVKINTYGCSSELTGYTGTDMDGIGTACHEFSHCMGLPDIYDVDYSGAFGMGDWDIMDGGSYGGDGYKPVGYNTYEKWVSGWMQPTELKSACYVKDLQPLSSSETSYIIYNEKTPTEYYLLENRQKLGTDTELPGHGLLVIHVDYNKDVWENNGVNDSKYHQRFSPVPADNSLSSYNMAGDPYPGTSNNTSLTDNSVPAATLFNANTDERRYLGKPVTEIAENNGLISFTFMGGASVDTPTDISPDVDASETAFTAKWGSVDGADTYNLQLRKKSENATVDESMKFIEDLSSWGQGFKGDGSTDISSNLNYKMSNVGWTGQKVYECPGMAKIGSSKAAGYLMSPAVSDPQSSFVTVRLKSKPYGNDVAGTSLSLVDGNGKDISSNEFDADGKMTTVVLENTTGGNYKVKISPKKRGYVEYVGIYDGEFYDADFADVASAPKPVSAMPFKANATQTFEGITSTSYTFSDLEKGATYQWRIQAVAGSAVSTWSPWQTVVLDNSTSIKTVSGSISDSSSVEIYTLSGMTVGKMTYREFLQSPLASGVYILKSNNKTIQTVK